MSFLPGDPDANGYIVGIDEYTLGGQVQGETHFQTAMEDQEFAEDEIAQRAEEWYGSLSNADSDSHGWQPSFSSLRTTHPMLMEPWPHLNDIDYVPSFPLRPASPIVDSELTINPIELTAPQFPVAPESVDTSVRYHHDLEGHPCVPANFVMRLKSATAESLAYLAMDTANSLWTYMSLNTLGRSPTDPLCETLYISAIIRRQRVQEAWVPEHVTVVLPVPVPSRQSSVRFDIQETSIETALDNKLFKDAMFGQLRTVARMFRAHAFGCANYLIHTSFDEFENIGIIPPIHQVTPEFKEGLKRSLKIGPFGYRIFHGNPESDDPEVSELFGNEVFCKIVQRALYDTDCRGWFGFLNDTDGPSGPIWTPLVSASHYTIAYVSAWLIDAMNDFCNGVNPSITEPKILKVNAMVNEISKNFDNVTLGFPGVSPKIQNSMRGSLLSFTRRAKLDSESF